VPVISAFTDHPTRPYVRLEVNWADVPSVTHARVLRVDPATGECVPLRPYVCYSGDYILLSCGHATFWDTEAPLDTPVYYLTEGLDAPCIPLGLAVLDQFTRVVVDGWGSATSGQAWTVLGGTVPGDYDVNGSAGTHTLTSDAANHFSRIEAALVNTDSSVEVTLPVVPLTSSVTAWLLGAYVNSTSHHGARLDFGLLGATTLTLAKRVAGAATILASVAVVNHVAGDTWGVRLESAGGTLKAKAWNITSGQAEPADWMVTAVNTTPPGGTQVALQSRRETGNTNGTVVVAWDNLRVTGLCQPCTPVTEATPTVTIASAGVFWLKDPVRPCNDQPVPLCAPGAPLTADCGGTGAITFIGMGTELYAANSFTMRPANRRRPVPSTRPRSDASTALRLQTTSFDAREQLLELLIPGSPLLFQGPAEYGIPDRYMDIGQASIDPLVPDLRVQIRAAALPYDTVDRPAGPTQGICGARVVDLCDLYPTWADLAATGMTWDDLVAGQASPVSANPDRRTWDDVNAEFASWNAVNTGGRTWDGLEGGL
jgi:hypothetical protein